MSVVKITVEEFRAAFPELADTTTYPDAVLQRWLTMAEAYISTRNYRVKPAVRVLMIELMAMHLMTLFASMGGSGAIGGESTAGGTITSATVGSVSVSLQAPIATDAYAQWIQSTPYGKALWALMSAQNPTGIFWVGKPCSWGIR